MKTTWMFASGLICLNLSPTTLLSAAAPSTLNVGSTPTSTILAAASALFLAAPALAAALVALALASPALAVAISALEVAMSDFSLAVVADALASLALAVAMSALEVAMSDFSLAVVALATAVCTASSTNPKSLAIFSAVVAAFCALVAASFADSACSVVCSSNALAPSITLPGSSVKTMLLPSSAILNDLPASNGTSLTKSSPSISTLMIILRLSFSAICCIAITFSSNAVSTSSAKYGPLFTRFIICCSGSSRMITSFLPSGSAVPLLGYVICLASMSS